jgi:16S rRNA processing protein RimM
MFPDIHPDYLLVGRINRPHGVRGEMRVEPLTNSFDYGTAVRLFVGRRPEEVAEYKVEALRFHQGKVLLKLAEIDDRNIVEGWQNWLIYAKREDVPPLVEGEFYLHQLIGMAVVTEEGEDLGVVSDTIQTGANDVFVVQGGRGELLLPDIEEVVLKVDAAERRITVRLMDGLVE